MLNILIVKDEATQVPRQITDITTTHAVLALGMPVYVLNDDGTRTEVTAENSQAEPADSATDAVPPGVDAAPVEEPPTEAPPVDPVVEVPDAPQAPSDEPSSQG